MYDCTKSSKLGRLRNRIIAKEWSKRDIDYYHFVRSRFNVNNPSKPIVENDIYLAESLHTIRCELTRISGGSFLCFLKKNTAADLNSFMVIHFLLYI